jgi:hypothetical protein
MTRPQPDYPLGKEPPEVMHIRWLFTKAHLAVEDAKDVLVPGLPVVEAQSLVLKAQVAALEAQVALGRWLSP